MHNFSTTPESAYLEYSNQFPSAGWMFTLQDGAYVGFSSGVLIDEHWVLTSAHGLLSNDGDPSSFYTGFQFGLGSSTGTDPGENYFADAWFIHPDYENIGDGPDLGLLYFAEGFQSVTPAQLLDQPLSNADLIHNAGFGRPGTPSTGFLPPDGMRRAGQALIESVATTPPGYFATRHNSPLDQDFLEIGMGLSPNSSGSPAFFQLLPDEFYVAGIGSYGTNNSLYGAVSGYTSLFENRGWINDTTSSIPEPSSLVLLGLGALIGGARRQRHLVNSLRPLLILTALAVSLVAPVNPAQAGLMHNFSTTPESAYLDYANQFPSAGWLFGLQDGNYETFSSGVLIDRHWVLTSAHGLLSDDGDPTSLFNGFQFGVGSSTGTDPGENYFADAWFIHPDYRNIGDGPDLGLLYFAEGFNTVTPAQLDNQHLANGDLISVAGFGRPATPSTGFLPADGRRRAGNALIEQVANTPNGYFATRHNGPTSQDFLELGMGGTPTFSGAPAYRGLIDDLLPNDFLVGGIASYASVNPGYGSVTGYTSVFENRGWINDTTSSIPEPSSILLLGVAGVVAMATRRQSAL